MRSACTLLLMLAFIGPALAQGDSSESDTTQQGGAVRAMGSVGNRGRKVEQSGIEIPNYGGNISAIRRLPLGTTSPRSRSFVRAPRYFGRKYTVAGQFEPSFFAAFP